IETYVAESTLLRTEKILEQKGEDAAKVQVEIVKTLFTDLSDKVFKSGKDAILSMAEGDEQRMMLMGLKRFTKYAGHNTKASRRLIAQHLINAHQYSI
ncbi:MAG: acyl-CoA dehydrogenase, partial [Cytophagales bacterium]